MNDIAKLLVGAASALLLSLGDARPARAEHEMVLFAGLGGGILGHVNLLPAYVSTAYYARHDDKRMSGGWFVSNLAMAITSGGVGLVLGGLGANGIASGETDARQAGMIALAAGVSLVAGSTLVIVGSVGQRSRPAGGLALAISPDVGLGERSARAGLRIAGVF